MNPMTSPTPLELSRPGERSRADVDRVIIKSCAFVLFAVVCLVVLRGALVLCCWLRRLSRRDEELLQVVLQGFDVRSSLFC